MKWREAPVRTPQDRARDRGVPVIPPRPQPAPPTDNPVIAVCGACGMEMRRVMNYVCSRADCPCFPQITC